MESKRQSGPQPNNHTDYPVTQPFSGMWTNYDCLGNFFDCGFPYYAAAHTCCTCNVQPGILGAGVLISSANVLGIIMHGYTQTYDRVLLDARGTIIATADCFNLPVCNALTFPCTLTARKPLTQVPLYCFSTSVK